MGNLTEPQSSTIVEVSQCAGSASWGTLFAALEVFECHQSRCVLRAATTAHTCMIWAVVSDGECEVRC